MGLILAILILAVIFRLIAGFLAAVGVGIGYLITSFASSIEFLSCSAAVICSAGRQFRMRAHLPGQQAQPLLLAHGRTGPALQNRPGGPVQEIRTERRIGADADWVAIIGKIIGFT